jgi:hypothetical protein
LTDLPFKLIGSPQKVKGSAGNGYIVLSWKPPIWNRLLEVEVYRIFRTDSTGNALELEVGPEDLLFNDTTIVNGRRYSYEITALNLLDESYPSVPVSVVGDGASPIFSSISPEPGSIFNRTSVELEWDCYDTGVGMGKVQISLDGGKWKQAMSMDGHIFTDLSDGNHTAVVRAYDMIGNRVETNTSFIVDTQPPTIQIRPEFEGELTRYRNATVTWSAEDDSGGLDYYMISVNGAKWEYWGKKEQYRFEGLVTAPFTISVKAVDRAGNAMNGSACYFCDIDPPIVEFLSPLQGSNFEGRTVYSFWSAMENGSGISSIWLYIDGSRVVNATDLDGFWIYDISPGPHVARLIVEDIAGNRVVESVNFTTGTLPQITSFSPKGSDVELTPDIDIGLSKDISTVDIFIEGVNGTTGISGRYAFFQPDEPLSPMTEYTVFVSGHDLHDLPFGPFNWSFRTVRYARVIGKIVDRGDRALVGVEIHLDGEKVTPTDYTGSFELFIDRGHHLINFSFDGYLNRSLEVDVTYGQLLEMENVVLEKVDESGGTREDKGSSDPTITVIIVIIIISVALLVVLVLILRKKIEPVQDPDGIEQEDITGEEDYISGYTNEPME